MAALIRQVTRLARQNVLFAGARTLCDVPPPSKPAVAQAGAKLHPLKKIDSQVDTDLESFYSEIEAQKNPSQSTEVAGLTAEEATETLDMALGPVAGDQRFEIREELFGTSDPFDMGFIKQEKDLGIFDQPVIVPTADGCRLVGCVCEEDNQDVVWMMIHEGEKKTCDCGVWFQAVNIPGAHVH